MSTRTRTTHQQDPEQQPPPHAAASGAPLPPRRRRRQDRRRLALAITSVIVALGAAGVVLVLAVSGTEGGSPAPDNQPFDSVVPEGIDGSDGRFYQDGPARGVPPRAGNGSNEAGAER